MASPVESFHNPFWDDSDMLEEPKVVSSAEASHPGSAGGGGGSKGKKRVGFTGGTDSAERSPRASWIGPLDGTESGPGHASPDLIGSNMPGHSRAGSGEMMEPPNNSRSHLPELSPQQTQEIHQAFEQSMPIPKPRPAIRRNGSNQATLADEEVAGPDQTGQRALREARAQEAFERGKRLELDERSEPNSRYASPERHRHAESIPLQDFGHNLDDDTDDEDDDLQMPSMKRSKTRLQHEAHRLVRKHTAAHGGFQGGESSGARSGAVTPTEEQLYAHDYRPRPEQYRGGILGALLKLYNHPHDESDGHSRSPSMTRLMHKRHDSSTTPTPTQSPPDSGTVSPVGGSPSGRHWYSRKGKNQSTSSLAQLIGSSASLGSPVVSGLGEQVSQRLKEQREIERPGLSKRSHSAGALAALSKVAKPRLEDEIKITVHIAETIARQRYLMRLCKALMMYGAPTHRLEEYMRMSARVLEIDAQFLYIPGSMIMSFDDANTHTTEVKLVKVAQGLDLGKLRDVHEAYKDVVHDRIGVEEATQRLKEVTNRRPKHSRWLRIPVYGLAAVCVGPFAFQARLIDLPIAFILGCILGVLQLVVAPASDLYANVFEIPRLSSHRSWLEHLVAFPMGTAISFVSQHWHSLRSPSFCQATLFCVLHLSSRAKVSSPVACAWSTQSSTPFSLVSESRSEPPYTASSMRKRAPSIPAQIQFRTIGSSSSCRGSHYV